MEEVVANVGFIWNRIIKCPVCISQRGPVHPTLEGPGSSDPLLLSPDRSM